MNTKARKNTWITLVVLFISSTIFRGILASSFGEYTIFADEFLHVKLAQNIAMGNGIVIRGALFNYTECLYSIVIAPVFLLTHNMEAAHTMILWINAALMSSAVFPIFLIAKKFLTESKHVWIAVAYGLLISEMNYTLEVMQENLNYPLMMWFVLAFTCVILEKRDNIFNVSGLGAFAFLLSRCKEMNQAITLAVVAYFAIQFLLDREERRQTAKNALIYIGTYLVTKLAFDFVMSVLLADAVKGGNVANIVLNVLNWDMIRQLFYPAITYAVFTVLAIGIFPLPMLMGNWKILSEKTKKLLVLALWHVFISISAICVLIYPAENLGAMLIRLHLRYYFYDFVIIFILFLQYYEESRKHDESESAPLFLLGCGVAFMSVLPMTLAWGFFDGVSTSYLLLMSENDAMKSAARCILVSITVLGMYFYFKKNMKSVVILTSGILTIAILANSIVYIKEEAKWKKNAASKNDAIILNEYLSSSASDLNSSEHILMIADRVAGSTRTFECYFNNEYRLTDVETINSLDVGVEINFNNLLLTTFNTNWYASFTEPPEFIISISSFPLQGYEEIDLGLEVYHLFQWNGEKVKLLKRESNIYGDRWLGDAAAKVQLAGSTDCTEAILALTVDSGVLGTDIIVNYTDDSGYSGSFIIPYPGERTTIEIPIYKAADAVSYVVTMTPTQAAQPNNGDSRQLSFRLLDYQVIE